MNLVFVFAIVCCVFVTAVFALVFWAMFNGLRDEARHSKQSAILEKEKPVAPDESDKPA